MKKPKGHYIPAPAFWDNSLCGQVVHCSPGTYTDNEIYIYGFVREVLFRNPRFTTYLLVVHAAGGRHDVYWPEVKGKYVIAETGSDEQWTDGAKFLECITEYIPAALLPVITTPKPLPTPKLKLKPLKPHKNPQEQTKVIRNEMAVMGDEYTLSDDLNTEHLEWFLREQSIDELPGEMYWRGIYFRLQSALHSP